VDLNPRIHAWYLLHLRWTDGPESWHHLVNVQAARQTLRLDPQVPTGIVISGASASRNCDLWSEKSPSRIEDTGDVRSPQIRLCDGEILVRRQTMGSRTAHERGADFLRDHVWRGRSSP